MMTSPKQIRPRLTQREVDHIKSWKASKGNVGIISDTHAPFTKEGYLEFVSDTFDRFGIDEVVHIGDEVVYHAISFHPSDPEGLSAGDEFQETLKCLEPWFKRFPDVKVCIGNHTERGYRMAMKSGLPSYMLKDYKQLWEAPVGWDWQFQHELHGVIYTHGTGSSGKTAHELRAQANRQSTVIGHIHSHAGIKFMASDKDLIFGMNVGCGIDVNSYAMAYGKVYPSRPVIGCGVVLDHGREPFFIPMGLQ
jgi:predicted phosphodiesterase